jgi:hypothetical protein
VANAVVYLPMPPCEVCLGAINNLALVGVKVRRIVYFEYRNFANTNWLAEHLPHISIESFHAGRAPWSVLAQASLYAKIRQDASDVVSAGSSTLYRD